MSVQRFSHLCAFVFLFIGIPLASAQVPGMFHFSGQLETTNADFDGDVDIQFALYDDPTLGGTPHQLWFEMQTVTVSNGRFHVMLGADSLNPVVPSYFQKPAVYVGITVGNDAEMTPRVRVGTVPYASLAGDAAQLGGVEATSYVTQTALDNANYSTGAHTENTNTQLTNAEVKTAALAEGFVTGAHTVNTDALAALQNCSTNDTIQWNGSAWVCVSAGSGGNGSGSVNDVIESKPFFGRIETGGIKKNTWTEVAIFEPMTAGNQLTPTKLNIQYQCSANSSNYDANWRYKIYYGDGGVYISPQTGYVHCEKYYKELLSVTLPTFDPCRGSIKKIALEGIGDNYYNSFEMQGKITVTGYETLPAGLTACKPFFGRIETGGIKKNTWTEVAIFEPMTAGNYLTPVNVVIQYQCSANSSNYDANWRYKIYYGDGNVYTSPATGYVHCEKYYKELLSVTADAHQAMKGNITKFALEGIGDNYYNSFEMQGKITVTGYEHAPDLD